MLASYSKYRPSGVEWLGDVPEGWEVKRLKFILAAPLKYGANESAELDDPDLPRYVRITDIDENDGLRDETFKSLPVDVATEYLLSDGDLLFARSGATAGKTFLYRRSWGTCAYAGYLIRARLDSREAVPNFIRYFTASSNYWQWLSSTLIQATIQNVSADKYASLWVPLPRVSEQRIIADFLDRETAKIDKLVAKKRTLTELLKEKRTALISRTVTGGLPHAAARAAGFNPHPKLKPSGIDWLGDVPEHWYVIPFRRAIDFLTDYEANGSFAGTKENVTIDIGEPYAWYVRATDLEKSRFGLVEGNRFCDESSYRWLEKTSLDGGELLVAKRGEIGKVYVMPRVECRATLAPNLYLIRLNGKLKSRYCWYWFSVDPGNAELGLANKSTTIGALYKDDLKSCAVLTPPVAEQVTITVFLDREIAKIDDMIFKVELVIDRLQEYRTALITSAVTGKIDLRDAAA